MLFFEESGLLIEEKPLIQNQQKSEGFYFKGSLTFETVAAVWNERERLLQVEDDIVIDLSEVIHTDSAGLALLLGLLRSSKEHKKQLRFTHIPHQLKTMIEVSDLEFLLE